jgi:hypothetical protein
MGGPFKLGGAGITDFPCTLRHRPSCSMTALGQKRKSSVDLGMSAYMSRVMSRRFRWAVHQRFTLLGDRRALRGSCDEVHVPCEGSHQLISGSSVPACHNAECMDHRRGGMGLIFGTAPSPSGHGATHPTHQRSLSGGVEIALSVADGKVSYCVLTIAPSGIRPCSR